MCSLSLSQIDLPEWGIVIVASWTEVRTRQGNEFNQVELASRGMGGNRNMRRENERGLGFGRELRLVRPFAKKERERERA